jgi:SAM-dependent methyltransferase
MHTYALLQNPGHNRVYFNASRQLAVKEICFTVLSVPIQDIGETEMGGVPYITFSVHSPLTHKDMQTLSRLSFTYALFLVKGEALLPLPKDSGYTFGDDISMHLKYTGKTHELFTRFMLNIALGYVKPAPEMPRILDPLCGKGTTLYEAMMRGCSACGIELDEKLAQEGYTYFKKYLETARHKHAAHTEKVSGQGPGGERFTALRYRIDMPKIPLGYEVIAGDTRYANTYYKKNSFHAIVGDLPYGVQHGSSSSHKKQKGPITRNAFALLAEALPQWLKVLKPGGAVALAWNLFLIPRADMEDLFCQQGLTLPPETKEGFAHRVDQAINRDFIIGVKQA